MKVKQCGKVRYSRSSSARKALARINHIHVLYEGEDKDVMHVYRCTLCGGWHLTSNPGNTDSDRHVRGAE